MKENKISLKKNVIFSALKQICQIFFPLITIPYITRILNTDGYGKVNFGSSVISYISLFASLGISTYAIREGAAIRSRNNDFKKFASEIFSINLITTAISYLILLMLINLPFFGDKKLLILIQSLIVLFTTLGTDWINNVYEDFIYITIRYVIIQLLSLSAMFIFVRHPNDYLIYAFILTMASSGANILNIFYIRKKYTKLKFTLDIAWKKHLIPILILFGNTLAITIYVNSDILMIGFFEQDSEVGIYSLASKIYAIIKQLMNAIIIVTIPRLTNHLSNGNKVAYSNLATKILGVLLLLVFPISVGSVMLSKEILGIVGGNKYMSGSLAFKILSAAIVFSLIASFYTNMVLILNKCEKKVLKITLISGLTNIVFNLVFIPFLGYVGAAITTLISEMIVAVYCYHISKPLLKITFQKNTFTSIISGTILVCVICLILKKLIENIFLLVVMCCIISVLGYFIVLLLFQNDIIIAELKKSGGLSK